MTKRGFTFVEMLLYLGLVSGFIVILTHLLLSLLDVQAESQFASSIAQDGRFLLHRLAYDVYRADTISFPASPGQSASTFSLDTTAGTYTYTLSNEALFLAYPGGEDRLTSPDTRVSDFSVTRLGGVSGPDSLQIVYSLTSLDGLQIQPYLTTLTLR